MKKYICKENLIKEMIESDMTVSPVSVINNCTTVTKEDICKEFKLEVLKYIELGIESTGHADQYSTGFYNALIWLRSCITGEEPKFLEMEQGKTKIKSFDEIRQETLDDLRESTELLFENVLAEMKKE